MARRFLSAALLCLFVLSACADVGRAQDAPKAFVIVVGISTYDDAKIQPRRHAEADARALHELLSHKEYFGADATNVRLLLNKQATRANILNALGNVAKQAQRDDRVLFAFFGRGGGAGKRVGLFGVDANVKKPADSAITADEVTEVLKPLASERVCAIMDVHLGGFENSDKSLEEADAQDFVRMFLGDERVWGYLPPIGRAVFVGANPIKAPAELQQHGVAATALLDALKGAADQDGYEPDGRILVTELEKHLKTHVSRLAREHGKTKDERDYQLSYFPGRFSHFPVSRNPAAYEAQAKLSANFAKVAGEAALPKDVLDEGQRLLRVMPSAKSMQDLRKVYQSFAGGSLKSADFIRQRDEISRKLAMSNTEAQGFGRSIMQAIGIIRREFHEELKAAPLVAWSVRGLYQEIDEPLPKELAARLDAAGTLGDAELTALIADARQRLGRREDLADKKDLDIALRHMTQEIRDKYTRYYDAVEGKRFTDSTTGKFAGIGVQIRRDSSQNAIRILTAFKDGPAFKAGLRGGDLLVSVTRLVDPVDGKRLPKIEPVSTAELDVSDVVKLVLGKPGTKIRLGVLKAGEKNPAELEVDRDWIMLESVVGYQRKADHTWNYLLDDKTGIGYIRLLEFSGTSPQDLRRIVTSLNEQGMKGLVLDLRFNPGGLLRTAIQVSDMFVEDGVIVTIKSRNLPDRRNAATGAGRESKFPMVCLINEHSASGSEILSACLQDHKRARIIGERSYGKGTVAGLFEFSPSKALFTVSNASFWRPNGKNLNRFATKGGEDEDWGVRPDEGFHVKLTNQERLDLYQHLLKSEHIVRQIEPRADDFRDRQLDKSVEYLRSQIK